MSPFFLREKEERELAVAMSASLHETKGKAANERPLPGRKKVLCAQKDPEPPPGFGVVKRHNDNEVRGGEEEKQKSRVQSATLGEKQKSKVGEKQKSRVQSAALGEKQKGRVQSTALGEKQKSKVQSAAVTMEDKPEAVAKDPAVELRNEKWPLLSAAHEHDTVRNQSGVVIAEKQASKGTENNAGNSSSPPVTPPPGYAKIIRPTKTTSSAVTKPSKKPGGVAALSSKAFPPLPSDSEASLSGAAPSTKSSGGSKVFEDIRKALDYNKEKFKAFQTLSGWFRGGEIPLTEYNTRCELLFGPRWAEIGPLIAKAMPQGEKREELIVLFGGRATSSKQKSKKSSKAKKKSSTPSAWTGGGSGGNVEEQSWTTQKGRGRSSHAVFEEEYPSLSAASKLPAQPPKTNNNAWNVSVHT